MKDMLAMLITVVVVLGFVLLGSHHLSVSWKMLALDQLLRTLLIERTSTVTTDPKTYVGQPRKSKQPTRGNEPCLE